jgi:hypothetical protein
MMSAQKSQAEKEAAFAIGQASPGTLVDVGNRSGCAEMTTFARRIHIIRGQSDGHILFGLCRASGAASFVRDQEYVPFKRSHGQKRVPERQNPRDGMVSAHDLRCINHTAISSRTNRSTCSHRADPPAVSAGRFEGDVFGANATLPGGRAGDDRAARGANSTEDWHSAQMS